MSPGTERYGEVLRRVERSGAEAVLMLLVGDDAVQFNRAFARPASTSRCCG